MSNITYPSYKNALLNDAKELWPSNFCEYEKEFNRCCFSIALKIIRELGLFQKKDEALSYSEIKDKGAIADQADYLMNKILKILIEENVIILENNIYRSNKLTEIEGPAELLTDLTRRYPAEQASFRWVARAYDGMLDFIKGKVYPEDIMFPWGNLDLVEEVYNTSQIYGFYSKLAGRAIKQLINHHFQRKIKMLEVGAGTGNGTRNVFTEINDGFEVYDFTDISKSLLKSSAKKFTESFMNFKLYDVMKSPMEQGFNLNFYNIILAVNVLHATNNAAEAVHSLSQLLNQQGILVISEISPPTDHIYRYMELTFGLLPSYSGYKDKNERPETPIIRPEEWIRIFQKAGLKDIFSIPDQQSADNRGGIIIGFK